MWTYNSTDSLYHYGVLGMRWGVRRYQNRDGTLIKSTKRRAKWDGSGYKNKDSSLVEAAKRRVKRGVAGGKDANSISDDELTAKVRRLNLEKQYEKLSKEKESPSSLEKTKKVVDATSTAVNQAKNINREDLNSKRTKERLDLSNMTDKELRDRINRENLERQYNDLFANEKITTSRGREFATNCLEIGGSVLAIGSSALGIALAIKALKG